ncbi:Peptidase propeptide and YPEB domain-containing protein [Modestobacter sp. DSM 44400]|uniref:PepSY domain-containing protein n=1 Tax=Modestobacter sp. DSM 44400 TaxID=1550230 RepID=UPI00089424D2|nr:PepSY domain-containing protein [Modestobacter sp. DSM 44400]SDY81209.1 Peptidase propeptide and YPEB domain-containing protein [Modestobacter sp. DSM 44400]
MNKRTKIGLGLAGGSLVAVLAVGGVAAASGGEDGGTDSGAAADQARSAALAAVPGGQARAVRQESDEGNAAYDVQVTKPDGSQIDVQLDQGFHVVGTQPAGQGGDDGDDG